MDKEKNLELFNHHQQDVRTRADSLAKAMFVLSGGALTVSIGLFMNKDRLPLSDIAISVLQASWWILFASIALGVLSLSTIILRDYILGEKWRKVLDGKDNIDVSGTPSYIEVLILLFCSLTVITFIVGFGCLAYVSTVTVNAISA